jgi:hypothetical protein
MRTTTILSALTAATLSSARLIGVSAPSTIAPSKPYTLTLLTENYIQTVADISVAWGYSTPPGYPKALGSYVGSAYLGPTKSNQLENVTVEVTAPSYLKVGETKMLSVSLFSLYGASSGPSVSTWNVSVAVGESVDGEVVSREAIGGVAQ